MVIESLAPDGRFLHKLLIFYLAYPASAWISNFCELDTSSQQLACSYLPWGPIYYHIHFQIYRTPSNSVTWILHFPMHNESCCQWNLLIYITFHIEEDTQSV